MKISYSCVVNLENLVLVLKIILDYLSWKHLWIIKHIAFIFIDLFLYVTYINFNEYSFLVFIFIINKSITNFD